MKRRAFTLFEVVMALAICTAAIVAVQWSGTGSVVQSQRAAAQSRELAAALRAARQTAIGSGQAARLRFLLSAAQSGGTRGTAGFVIERATDETNFVALTGVTRFPLQLVGQSNTNEIIFTPTGEADKALQHTFRVGDQSYIVSVDRLGGRTHYAQQ